MRSLETNRAGFWTAPDPDGDVEELLDAAAHADRRPALRHRTGAAAGRVGGTGRRGLRRRPVVRRRRSPGWWRCAPSWSTRRCSTSDLLRRAKHSGLSDRQIAALRPELAGEDGVRTLRAAAGHPSGVQDRRHLRGRVRGQDAVPLQQLRTRPRRRDRGGPADREAQGADPGLRAQPDRPGHRVRLQLRARGDHAEPGRFRDRDGQLQPRDGVHRLRHRRPAVLRAADLRGRARGLPRRIAVRRRRSRCGRGHRAARRPDPAGAGAAARGRRRADRRHQPRRPSTWPRTAARSARCSAPPGCPRRGSAPRPPSSRPAGSPPRSATRCWCGRRTCWAGAAWRSSTTRRRCSGYITRATELSPEHPVLVDRFLEDAIEIDVDALCDGTEVYIGGVMEHIEEAGIHSGDSACALPPVTLGRSDIEKVRRATEAIAHGIGVVGLLNVQYALKDDVLYVLEANPRASRTVPFVSKATAVPLAKACARIMLGATIAQLRDEGMLAAHGRRRQRGAATRRSRSRRPCCRSTGSARPTARAVDSLLGPGDEVDRRGDGHRPRLRQRVRQEPDRRLRFAAGRRAPCSCRWPTGTSVRWCSRSSGWPIWGSGCWPPRAPRRCCAATEFPATRCASTSRSRSPDRPAMSAVDAIRAGDVDMVINTPYGNSGPRIDGYEIRSAAVAMNIPCVTTVQGASAAVQGIEAGIRGDIGVRSLQELHSHAEQWRARSDAGVRRPAGRRRRRRRGPLCLGIDPHPELLRAWDLPATPRRAGRVLRHLRRGVRRLRRRQAAGGVLRGVRRRGLRGAGAHHRRAARGRRAGAGRRQARRHRLDDGGLRRRPGRATRRWPPTP